MGTLRDLASEPAKRKQLIEDATQVIDAEVSDKGGISGMAIKAAYAMTKGLAPGMVHKILDNLANDFLDALQPFYEQAKAQGVALRSYLEGKSSDAANALLAITDQRAAGEQGALKKGYEKLRPTAQKHVEAAVPRLADLITRFAS